MKNRVLEEKVALLESQVFILTEQLEEDVRSMERQCLANMQMIRSLAEMLLPMSRVKGLLNKHELMRSNFKRRM